MQDQNLLSQWIAEQQRASSLSKKQPAPELHLHQHHHPTAPPAAEHDRRPERMHPLTYMFSLFLLSIALSVPLALLAAIVESSNRPSVNYVQPSQERW